MTSSKKPEVRIQTSILNSLEKKALVWMALRIPRKINSDHLTVLGFIGALLSSAGYILSNFESNFLWLASFGLLVNWFGDSLDGTLARVRNAQRPIYGFFIDHSIDGLTVFAICVGAGLSPYINFAVAMLILAGYLLLSVLTYINTYLKGEFKITYHKLGPTEFRLIVILINTLFIYYPTGTQNFVIDGVALSLFDVIGIVIAFILFFIYLVNFFIDKNKYANIDPPKY
ncbi:MAG: archaetidylinositol phosphate synthase [Tenuifilum sp.]|jgi:phosphatidylglycerophosphate synthase|uniref:CDP-alcohol phosphatidyltransferase family protein n=1 Tax=Tenuifilum sp. TaxID=2760880 RepID=UPI0024AC32D5|nr:CDP-alcohol phosphatidyltransferase family protein [Tenuifilum sp.]MDI3527965.1 archaetidylinositol phosphate synthase [Tenuifilum sp.]